MSRNKSQWMMVGALTLALASGQSIACQCIPPGLYVGVFGGGGSLTNTHASLRGTAFFPELTSIGPLAVDAEGSFSSHSTWLGGGHFGYAFKNPCWLLTPAFEFEGFYLSTKFNGVLDAPHTALPEHTFDTSLSLNAGVYLINSVFTLNTPICNMFHPYIGAGIGGAVLHATGGDATQISPVEVGVNHLNSENSASENVFAGQVKAGVSYSLSKYVNLFAEYRFLYLGSSRYNFGSTVYPGHAPTSPWTVNADGMEYNLGVLGIEFSA